MKFNKAQVAAINEALAGKHELTPEEIEAGSVTVEIDSGYGTTVLEREISRYERGIAVTTSYKDGLPYPFPRIISSKTFTKWGKDFKKAVGQYYG